MTHFNVPLQFLQGLKNSALCGVYSRKASMSSDMADVTCKQCRRHLSRINGTYCITSAVKPRDIK